MLNLFSFICQNFAIKLAELLLGQRSIFNEPNLFVFGAPLKVERSPFRLSQPAEKSFHDSTFARAAHVQGIKKRKWLSFADVIIPYSFIRITLATSQTHNQSQYLMEIIRFKKVLAVQTEETDCRAR